MPISEEMKHLIIERANYIVLAEQARCEGIMDLREAGLIKVRKGITSLAELDRVITQ